MYQSMNENLENLSFRIICDIQILKFDAVEGYNDPDSQEKSRET